MRFAKEQKRKIFDRTAGCCHLCGVKLAFCNYNRLASRGGWEVEHSIPKSKGGTDHMNNLYAAHISCNRAKSNFSTRTARRWNGQTRAPLSVVRRLEARKENAAIGGFLGALLGAAGGPLGMLALGALGATIGYDAQS